MRLLSVLLLMSILLGGCSGAKKAEHRPAKSPEEALAFYFEALNQHDADRMLQLFSQNRRRNASSDIKHITTARLIRIDYDKKPVYDAEEYARERGFAEVRILWWSLRSPTPC